MSCAKPYIGCKIRLISKSQNCYEGILYTIDKVNSTVVLAKVRCLGTEGRPTHRPTPPKDEIYEYITFRGSDIKDITPCEPPHYGLPPDPAILQSSSSSGIYSAHAPFNPLRMHSYNQLAASSLLNQHYSAALGLARPALPGFQIREGPMVEKAVQTLHVGESWQRRGSFATQEQEQRWDRRRPQWTRGTRRPRNRTRGQLMVANVPSATLKFDTDFDFDSSNAQFNKEALEREVKERRSMRDKHHKVEEKEQTEMHLFVDDDHSGPEFYYDKAKSFFDNISSDRKFRLTWAEERKRNLETFGVPGWFLRGRGFWGGRRQRGAARTLSS